MNGLKKFFSNKKLVSSAVMSLLMFVALTTVTFSMLRGTKAWFAQNKVTNAKGMTLTAKEDSMHFADTFTAKVVMGGTQIAYDTYKRDTDGMYYLWDEETEGFSLDSNGNKQALIYSGLYPGEYVEITMKITCTESKLGSDYQLYFSDLSGSDTFTTSKGIEYSVLGVYRLEVKGDSDDSWTDKGFLDTYDDETEGVNTFDVTDGTWDTNEMEDGYVTVTFRLYVDLTQYLKLEGTTQNMLSEKTISIGAVVLAPKEGA